MPRAKSHTMPKVDRFSWLGDLSNRLLSRDQGRGSPEALNVIYNLADFVNKIAFGVVIWSAATSDAATGNA